MVTLSLDFFLSLSLSVRTLSGAYFSHAFSIRD